MTIYHEWFRKWLGTKYLISHCLSQWWYRSLMHIYIYIYVYIYALPTLNDLTHQGRVTHIHYNDVIMRAMASQITSLMITTKLHVTAGNSPATREFPAQMASNMENVSIWWRHHDANMRCQPKSSLVQIMACRLLSTKSLSGPMLAYCQLDPWEHTSIKF